MSAYMLRYFQAIHKGHIYQIYVSSFDLICVRMGTGPIPRGGPNGAVMAGAVMFGLLGAVIGAIIAKLAGPVKEVSMEQFERQIAAESDMLARRDLEGIRSYVTSLRKGFELDPDRLDAVRIDQVAKWKRWFFCKPDPALIVSHPSKGDLTFVFRKRKDVVIGVYEVDDLLGENLEIAVDLGAYVKALRKYGQMRSS